jgi:hypothetical protein
MNFIVATLINMFPGEEAFVFSCTQVLLFRHDVSGFYKPGFPKLGVTLWQFDRIVQAFLPRVHSAIEMSGTTAEFYAMQWFMTLFASDLQQKVVFRIWDRFLVVGWQIIVQIGLALLHKVQDEIQELDACELLVFLKKFTRLKYFDCDELLSLASEFDVPHQMLSELEAAYIQGEGDHAKLILDRNTTERRTHWFVQRGKPIKSCEADACETMLDFLIHNLDNGSTAVMEEAWNEYVHESHTVKCEAMPMAAFSKDKGRMPAVSGNSKQSCSKSNHHQRCAVGSSFWLQGMQPKALKASRKV